MGEQYTIGDLADAAGVPITTVRYYERRGLLVPDGRTEGNFRLYAPEALDRLRFIRSAQQAGFTLKNIATLLKFQKGSKSACRDVQRVIEDRLKRVAEDIAHLQHVQEILGRWLRECRKAERTGRCGVLEGLKPHRSNGASQGERQ